MVFNLGFNKKGDDKVNNWVYFPEKKYSFYRIGYYDNIFGDDRLSLYVELGFDKDQDIIADDYLKIVLEDLNKAGIINDHELVSYAKIFMDPAYVHVNKKSDSDKQRIQTDLAFDSVYSIGRYGDWKYCSIEDNIIEAKELVNKIKK